MALVHTSFHANPFESSRLSQRELLERIFSQHGAEDEHVHHMDYEESSSDSGSDYEMEEYHEGRISVFLLVKSVLEGKFKGIIVRELNGKVFGSRVKSESVNSLQAKLTRVFFFKKHFSFWLFYLSFSWKCFIFSLKGFLCYFILILWLSTLQGILEEELCTYV